MSFTALAPGVRVRVRDRVKVRVRVRDRVRIKIRVRVKIWFRVGVGTSRGSCGRASDGDGGRSGAISVCFRHHD